MAMLDLARAMGSVMQLMASLDVEQINNVFASLVDWAERMEMRAVAIEQQLDRIERTLNERYGAASDLATTDVFIGERLSLTDDMRPLRAMSEHGADRLGRINGRNPAGSDDTGGGTLGSS
jgi:hypothetical protein